MDSIRNQSVQPAREPQCGHSPQLSGDSLHERFLRPSTAYRGKPFWCWNGKLDREELIRQIHVMKAMGYGGFFMHSRTGLVTEYLGEEWFACINAGADEAERLGMEAWLYDEDRWPSGTAGGMVTEDPRFRMRFIRLDVELPEAFQWTENTLAAFVGRVEGLEVHGCRRLAVGELPPVDETRGILHFKVEEMASSSFYNGYTYVDTLNPEATERFLQLTHDRYAAKCGDRMGSSIKGIFTDEPHRGALMDGFGLPNRDAQWLAPWTPGLFAAFADKYGYDLSDRLPELFLMVDGQPFSQVKWHYVDLLQDLFLQSFLIPIRQWCGRHGIQLTGHGLHEDSLTAQTAMQGSLMRMYEQMDVPGVDVLTEGNRCFWIVKQLSSAARQLGKPWLLSELYGCTGWQMDFEAYKGVGDWQALLGINLRCHHLAWHTMAGEAKRDFPASMLHQSAWWKEFDHLETYFSRLGVFMSQGTPCCDVLVLNPVESLWGMIHPGWSAWLGAKTAPVQELEGMYTRLYGWLMGARIDFDYGDEEMLGRMADIRHDAAGRPLLVVGEAAYRVVLIAGMLTLRGTSLRLLQTFAEAGGTVLFAGNPPVYVDALPSSETASLVPGCVQLPWEGDAITSACRPLSSFVVDVCDGTTGLPIPDIHCQVRAMGDTRLVMLLNLNRESGYDKVTLRFPATGELERWHAVDGTVQGVTALETDGALSVNTRFLRGQEQLYVLHGDAGTRQLRPPAREASWGAEPKAPGGRVPVGSACAYSLDEPNVCVLDLASWRLDGEAWQPREDVLKIDRMVRRRHGLEMRGGEMLQPWVCGIRRHKPVGMLELLFVFHVEALPDEALFLAMEAPEEADCSLNGTRLETPVEDLRWVDACFRLRRIPLSMVHRGANELSVRIAFHEGSNLENLYLLGSFGVRVENGSATLMALPDTVTFTDLANQGFPFYGGRFRYHLALGGEPAPDRRWVLRIGNHEAACLKILTGKAPERVLGWPPFETEFAGTVLQGEDLTVEAVLTRRNTFGPLHQLPVRAQAYGPDSFLSEGDGWSLPHVLYPAGLLEIPVVEDVGGLVD